ncbi:MAG: sigma-70 family RNA polymerase sigma factor [Fulvivirga sp.]|nr:sigma-70 family RNA polymerase sigma factor [Fulvivirga sp.]
MNLNIYSDSEDKLIEKCLSDNRKAQQKLYDHYAPKMLGVCIRYVKDRDQAEEIMIGGFIKVFNKLDQFKKQGSFEGWIRRIMVNECLTFIRKNKSIYLEVDIEAARATPDYSNLESNLQAEELLQMIHELPTGYQTVFNLYAIEGYSHKEIAEHLAISENTSKSQLSRARSLLQKKLLEQEKIVKEKLKHYE